MKCISVAPLWVGSWRYPLPLDYAGKKQTPCLITKIRKFRTKKFYNIGPRAKHMPTLTAYIFAADTNRTNKTKQGGLAGSLINLLNKMSME